MDLKLRGKRALVTGGSRGIGRAIALRLLEEGAEVAIAARTRSRLEQATAELKAATGGRVVPVEVELTSAESIQRMVREAVEALGGLEILVNAGARVSGGAPEDFEHVTDEMILRDFEEKFLGYLRCIREAVPWIRRAGGGSILNLGGNAARQAGGISAGARNVAVVNLTRNLSREFGKDGITVNAIHPGTIVTETFRERMEAQARLRGIPYEQHVANLAAQPAIGRLVTAEEVADVAVFLVSPRAVGITGEVVAVTGGAGNAVYY
ncbi:MAG: SDR family oxidoreductase [Firmicutes bacterium]|nr:SDR family oxidoreductase [Alicyclobacillaceae bacterium]MCL6497088.1 SDR family oxidoreductase [Bacillota bacterium]